MTLAPRAQRHPRLVDWGIRIDRAPAAGWLALQAAALGPTWVWMAGGMRDGSDDPLGLLALAALAALLWRRRRELRAAPRLGWLALAAASAPWRPRLLRTGVGARARAATAGRQPGRGAGTGLRAAGLPADRRVAAAAGASGWRCWRCRCCRRCSSTPAIRCACVTAEASRWLLAPAFAVAREGSTLLVDGRLVIVDAPCSGVQMVWLGYFTACAVALWAAARRPRLRRPGCRRSASLVLAGNIVRNSRAGRLRRRAAMPLAPWAHDALGPGRAGAGVRRHRLADGRAPRRPAGRTTRRRSPLPGRTPCGPCLSACSPTASSPRVAHKAAFALAMAAVPGLVRPCRVAPAHRAPAPIAAAPEWPREWDGAALRPLALGEVEQRFAQRFPGAIARLTDGRRLLVLRQVQRPTRMLHPARTATARWAGASSRPGWNATHKAGCGVVSSPGVPARPECTFASASSMRKAALSPTLQPGTGRRPCGHSQGPWQAVTVADRCSGAGNGATSRPPDAGVCAAADGRVHAGRRAVKKSLVHVLLALAGAGLVGRAGPVPDRAAGAGAVRRRMVDPRRRSARCEFEVGVPTALRLATSPWFAPYLDGRTFDTRFGPVRTGWDDAAPLAADPVRALPGRTAGARRRAARGGAPADHGAARRQHAGRTHRGAARPGPRRRCRRTAARALGRPPDAAGAAALDRRRRRTDRPLVRRAGAQAAGAAARTHRRHAGLARPDRAAGAAPRGAAARQPASPSRAWAPRRCWALAAAAARRRGSAPKAGWRAP